MLLFILYQLLFYLFLNSKQFFLKTHTSQKNLGLKPQHGVVLKVNLTFCQNLPVLLVSCLCLLTAVMLNVKKPHGSIATVWIVIVQVTDQVLLC